MGIFAYITINLLLFSSWYVLLYRNPNFNKGIGFVDRILGTFILSLAQIVLSEMILGIIFKKLFALPLYIFNISISLCVFAMAKPQRSSIQDIFRDLKDNISYFLNILKADLISLTVFILFFVYLCYLIFIGYLFPSYSWDALLSHLPTVGFILQSGSIENIPYNGLIYTFINVFPKDIDLFFLWNIIFLKSDAIVDLSQLPFTLSGIFAIYNIASKLGIKERYAIFSSLLFFFAPIIILQSTTNYIDIAVSVLFLIAINFIISTRALPANVPIFLGGLTAGILFGSKGSGPVFITALSILFLINELRMRRKGYSIKKIFLRYAIYFIIPIILFGGYWYLQNWLYYGNPVYPFIVKFFGRTIFWGMFNELLNISEGIKNLHPVVRYLYIWLEKTGEFFYASEDRGFGPIWFILFLPSILFSFFYVIWKRSYDFLFIILVIVFVFALVPANWAPRYVIFALGLGCLSFAFVLNYFEKRATVLMPLALLLIIYTSLNANSSCVTPEKIREFIYLSPEERTLVKMEPCIINNTLQEEYGLWSWINSNVRAGDTLAYTFTPSFLAPLWNRGFSNKIVYVKAGRFEDWIRELNAKEVTYIILKLKPRGIESWWLERLKDLQHMPQWSEIYKRFSLLYSDSEYQVFRFIPKMSSIK